MFGEKWWQFEQWVASVVTILNQKCEYRESLVFLKWGVFWVMGVAK